MSENNNSIGMNELVDYQKKTYSPFMERIMKFLWKCGGADAQILQYAPYSDHIKNAGIGGVVLATTVMATIAMGFAMHTIFASPSPSKEIDPVTGEIALNGNWFITIPVALIWGLIIFNLDRFIVSTVKGDGTEKITRSEWGSMLPRLFMAVLIGLTISAPLETFIFKREIHREWMATKRQLSQARMNEVRIAIETTGEVNELQSKITIKTKESYTADSLLTLKDKMIENLVNGVGVPRCTEGPNCRNGAHRELYKQRDQAYSDKAKYRRELDSLNNLLSAAQEKDDKKTKLEADKILNEKAGFLDQIMMLEKLSSESKEIPDVDPVTFKPLKEKKKTVYGSAFWPIWLVRLLFMIVEIAPVIFKFMIWKSSYDYMQDNVAQILEAKQGISLELIPDENNNLHKVKENYNARRIVEVAKRQNELEKENAIHAITLYAEKEREEIEKDPERFIQPDQDDKNKG
jgi:hypothetical protein